MKALILCGGQGTRAYPYTRRVPKALMPVQGLPVLEQVMRIYASQGVTDFVLALGHLGEDIARYADTRRSVYGIEAVDTGETTDTGTRVRLCLDRLGERFHCTYVDGLGDVDLRALESAHRRGGGLATMTITRLRSQYGVVRVDGGGRVQEFVEKPVLPDHWINAGFFVFERDAIASTRGDNLELDILPGLAERRALHVHRHTGFWRSMDTHKDQQELDQLWTPYSRELAQHVDRTGDVPDWLARRHELARIESA